MEHVKLAKLSPLRRTPVFREINECNSKQNSFFLKAFLLIFILLTPAGRSFFLTLSVVLSILHFSRLIARWYYMLKSAASFPHQLFEKRQVSRFLLLTCHLLSTPSFITQSSSPFHIFSPFSSAAFFADFSSWCCHDSAGCFVVVVVDVVYFIILWMMRYEKIKGWGISVLYVSE